MILLDDDGAQWLIENLRARNQWRQPPLLHNTDVELRAIRNNAHKRVKENNNLFSKVIIWAKWMRALHEMKTAASFFSLRETEREWWWYQTGCRRNTASVAHQFWPCCVEPEGCAAAVVVADVDVDASTSKQEEQKNANLMSKVFFPFFSLRDLVFSSSDYSVNMLFSVRYMEAMRH